jgi:hypothetical protein
MLRAMLLELWEQVRRDTGLSLRLPEIFVGLSEEGGLSVCTAAARTVVEQGQEAVRQYPLEGRLPELRLAGQGLVITFDVRERRLLQTSLSEIEHGRMRHWRPRRRPRVRVCARPQQTWRKHWGVGMLCNCSGRF